MTREQMAEYDLFLDENDWDIYYWATQDEPSSTAATTSTSSSSTKTEDTSSASYGSATEAATAESAHSTPSNSSSSSHTTTTPTSTGGTPLTGEHTDTKASASPTLAPESDASQTQAPPPTPYAGEWAQTVGAFKPAYRPVPARWRDSETLRLLRQHVRARAREKGGMAFMPALRS
jgi:cell division septation protein DedD